MTESVRRRIPAKQDTAHTVLVVDDDETIRNLTSMMLERGGYKAITASNGLEGLLVLQDHPEVRVVVLDVLMPIMNGEEAFLQMREQWPSVRVIVISALSFEDLHARFGAPPPDGILRKPFTVDTLNGAISGALS